MRKELVKALKKRAIEVGGFFSKPDREFNYGNETFKVHKIIPLSEFTAAVIYIKTPSMKKATMFFYWMRNNGGNWAYFFPSDSHILGMEMFGKLKAKVEVYNFDKNE